MPCSMHSRSEHHAVNKQDFWALQMLAEAALMTPLGPDRPGTPMAQQIVEPRQLPSTTQTGNSACGRHSHVSRESNIATPGLKKPVAPALPPPKRTPLPDRAPKPRLTRASTPPPAASVPAAPSRPLTYIPRATEDPNGWKYVHLIVGSAPGRADDARFQEICHFISQELSRSQYASPPRYGVTYFLLDHLSKAAKAYGNDRDCRQAISLARLAREQKRAAGVARRGALDGRAFYPSVVAEARGWKFKDGGAWADEVMKREAAKELVVEMAVAREEARSFEYQRGWQPWRERDDEAWRAKGMKAKGETAKSEKAKKAEEKKEKKKQKRTEKQKRVLERVKRKVVLQDAGDTKRRRLAWLEKKERGSEGAKDASEHDRGI